MTRTDPHYVHCTDCDYHARVEEGALRAETPPLRSAKRRRAGHISGAGCDSDAVVIRPACVDGHPYDECPGPSGGPPGDNRLSCFSCFATDDTSAGVIPEP